MFYKYVSEEWIDNILRDRLIRFSQFKALNDPFESLILFDPEDTKRVAKDFFKKEGQNVIGFCDEMSDPNFIGTRFMNNNFNDNFGILSLSKNKNNLLMWSHYTNNYKGFVIGFNSEHNFFSGKYLHDDGQPYLLRNVLYTDKRRIVKLNAYDIMNFFCEKPIEWAYEKEVRIFKILPKTNKYCEIDQFGQKICLYKFPKDLIQEVIIGHNIEPELRKKVIQYCFELNNEIKVYETTLSKTKYEIEFNKL